MRPMTRGRLDALVYALDLTRPVPPPAVSRVAHAVLGRQLYLDTPETYLAAIDEALRDPARIARDGEDEHHLRRYLETLRAELRSALP